MSSGSNPDSERIREGATDSGSDNTEGVWLDTSDEEREDGDTDVTQLGDTVTCVNAFTVTNQSSHTVQSVPDGQEQLCQMQASALVPSSGLDIENRSDEIPPGSVTQYNINRIYNIQQFGDVTVKGTKNLNIGGTQNISSKSGPSQEEEEEKTLTTTQKIRKRTESRLQTWTRGMVKTQSLVNLLDKIHKGATWVTVKGSPGEGKTTTAYMALEELYTEGRQVFQVISPEEFSEVIMTSSKPVIMLDDVFGDLEFDETEWVRWKSALKLVLDVKEHRSDEREAVFSTNKGPTVILVGRDYVLNSASSDMGRLSEFLIQEQYVIDMSGSFERDLQEKLNIWYARVETHGIELPERDKLKICKIKSQHGFPHVCRLFVEMHRRNKEINAEKFFTSPLAFLNHTIAKFMKNTHKVTLFEELIKGEGKLRVRDLRHLKQRTEIIQTATDLVGPYLRKEEDYFMFDHPSIYDCVAYNLCKMDPLFAIENCNLQFIHQRLRLGISSEQGRNKHSTSSHSSFLAEIPRSYIKDLAIRFAVEIRNGNLFLVLSHQACSDKVFVEEVLSEIQQPFADLFRLSDNKTDDPFLYLIASNRSPVLLQNILASKTELSTTDKQTVLFGICRFGAGEALSDLVKYYGDLDMNVQTKIMAQTPLMIASESKDNEFVHQVMLLTPDLNVKDIAHKTAFHYFCENGHVSAAEQMLVAGTDVNLKDKWERSPLWFACLRDKVQIVKLLLDRGARLDADDLYNACRARSVDVITYLHNEGLSDNVVSKYGDTLLHMASQLGLVQVVSLFAGQDGCLNSSFCLMDVDERSNNGRTPLYEAAGSGSKECVDLLLEAGADVKAQSSFGYTPLHKAAWTGSDICVDTLLKSGADVNVQGDDGYSSLHWAAKIGSKKCVDLLIKAGADVNIQNMHGNTALHMAPEHMKASSNCVEVLLKAGADVNLQNEDGDTPLHIVAYWESGDFVEMLLKAGANVNAQGKDGKTPLLRCAERGEPKTIATLLKAGADVNLSDYSGLTPLHKAFERVDYFYLHRIPDIRICKLIIRAGADVNKQDEEGNTPLHVLCRTDSDNEVHTQYQYSRSPASSHEEAYKSLVVLLVNAGADVNVYNNVGEKALHGWCKTLLGKPGSGFTKRS